MSIAIQVHDREPGALAELIARTMQGGAIVDNEPEIAHLSALVRLEEREAVRRRAAWHWLNSLSSSQIDHDNDWSDV